MENSGAEFPMIPPQVNGATLELHYKVNCNAENFLFPMIPPQVNGATTPSHSPK
jgi:hypothetical protein